MKAVTDPAGVLMRRLLFLLRWRVWVQERLQPSEWQVTLLWAAIAGFLLGWIYQRTGVLAVPILAHFLVNALSLTMLRRDYLSFGLSESDLDESEEGDAT